MHPTEVGEEDEQRELLQRLGQEAVMNTGIDRLVDTGCVPSESSRQGRPLSLPAWLYARARHSVGDAGVEPGVRPRLHRTEVGDAERHKPLSRPRQLPQALQELVRSCVRACARARRDYGILVMAY